MKPLVATNIEHSFRLLNNGVPEYSEDFQTLACAQPSYKRPFALRGSLTVDPVLYNDGARVVCAQSEYLGFYALKQVIRGILQGINYQIAGDILASAELYGPAVAAYYTAAFHALNSFLALEGRVFLDNTIWPLVLDSEPVEQRDPFIAMLTRHNAWVFEPRSRNHRQKWLEVSQAYVSRPEDLPDCFHNLFRYMYRGVSQPNVDIMEKIQNPSKYRLQLSDRFEEFLIRIAETRHRAIYASFGSDPDIVEGLWNRDLFSTRGIDNQTSEFGAFSDSLLTHVSLETHELINDLNPNPEVRKVFGLSVHLLWFDDPLIDSISNPRLRGYVTDINAWIIAAP